MVADAAGQQPQLVIGQGDQPLVERRPRGAQQPSPPAGPRRPKTITHDVIVATGADETARGTPFPERVTAPISRGPVTVRVDGHADVSVLDVFASCGRVVCVRRDRRARRPGRT